MMNVINVVKSDCLRALIGNEQTPPNGKSEGSRRSIRLGKRQRIGMEQKRILIHKMIKHNLRVQSAQIIRYEYPTFLLIEPLSRTLYIGSDDPIDPAIYSYNLSSAQQISKYTIPPVANASNPLLGPSGLLVADDILYAASRSAKAIFKWNITTSAFLGPFILNLPDIPEALLLLQTHSAISIEHSSNLSLIPIIVVVSLLALGGICAAILGVYRAYRLSASRPNPISRYQQLSSIES